MKRLLLNSLLAIFCCLTTTSCTSDGGNPTEEPPKITKKDFTVNIHLRANIDNLNSVLARSTEASEVLDYNVHTQLLKRNPADLQQRPLLAVDLPEIKTTAEGKMELTYEIRPEAVWDNGTPIQASDVIFTLKMIKNPKVQANAVRAYLDFIEDVVVDENNPKKFTIIANKIYFLAEAVSGGISIYPEYHYDPEGFMAEFSLPELSNPANLDALVENPRIVDFAESFNNNFSTEPNTILGAGAYKVVESVSHKHVILERKEKWWGNDVNVDYIKANPKKLVFKIIDNDNTTETVMKEGGLDLVPIIQPDNYKQMKENAILKENFNFHTQQQFSYYYIGLNMKNKKLTSPKTREALACLVDKDRVVTDLQAGIATVITGPVSPLKKDYNKDLKPIAYNLERAAELLKEDGWADSDGDNVLDKKIEGKKVSLELEILYPQGKKFYSDLSKIMKDEAERVGVKIELNSAEGKSLQKKLQERDYELYVLGWRGTPNEDDFTQVWHTKSDVYDGSNMVGFGNEKTDRIIEKIKVTTDKAARTKLYYEFQAEVAKAHPYIFLSSPNACMAISKKFKNPNFTAMPPGYMAGTIESAE